MRNFKVGQYVLAPLRDDKNNMVKAIIIGIDDDAVACTYPDHPDEGWIVDSHTVEWISKEYHGLRGWGYFGKYAEVLIPLNRSIKDQIHYYLLHNIPVDNDFKDRVDNYA